VRALEAAAIAIAGDPRFSGPSAAAHLRVDEDPLLHAYVVSFEPCARTAWHRHERGQLLICTLGSGYVGTREGRSVELRPGIAVWTDPGEDHWHGAGPNDCMSHVAVQTETPGIEAATWLEPVSDREWQLATG
jgi:quercetin dioxygenase-like cupin family protein